MRTEIGLQTVREAIPASKDALQTLTKDIETQQAKEREMCIRDRHYTAPHSASMPHDRFPSSWRTAE